MVMTGRRHYLNPQLIKSYIWQLMKSLDHMHKKGIFHRDIKPENILIESSTDVGRGLKLADFGSCRGIYSKQPYTEYIRYVPSPRSMHPLTTPFPCIYLIHLLNISSQYAFSIYLLNTLYPHHTTSHHITPHHTTPHHTTPHHTLSTHQHKMVSCTGMPVDRRLLRTGNGSMGRWMCHV